MNQGTIGPATDHATSSSKVLWYCFGEPFPELPETIGTRCLQLVEESIASAGAPHFKSTTWEAAQEYLVQEQEKPKGSGRDLLREMCMFHVLKIHNNQKIAFVSTSSKKIISLSEGATILYPTVDLPPHIFGTRENGESPLLVNLNSNSPVPATATILMAYLTRTTEEIPRIPRGSPGDINTIQVNYSPYD